MTNPPSSDDGEVNAQSGIGIAAATELIGALDFLIAIGENIRRFVCGIRRTRRVVDTEIGEDFGQRTTEGAILSTASHFAKRLEILPRRIRIGKLRFLCRRERGRQADGARRRTSPGRVRRLPAPTPVHRWRGLEMGWRSLSAASVVRSEPSLRPVRLELLPRFGEPFAHTHQLAFGLLERLLRNSRSKRTNWP